MYKQIIVLTLLAIASVSYAQVNGWANCGSPLGELYELRLYRTDMPEVSNCLQTPCPIVKGQDYTIQVDVGARGYSSSLNFTTTVQILFATITILEGNACDDPAVRCPVSPGDYFTFTELINIPTAVPTILVNPLTRVLADNGDTAMCFQVPVQLMDP